MIPCEERLARCRERNERLFDRVITLRGQRDEWRQRAQDAETNAVRGRYFRTPEVERWRSLLSYAFDHYARLHLGRDATEYEIDFGMGVVYHESRGNHIARSHLEWIGTPPPGYDGSPPTRATGLCQHVPAYWESRSKAAGFGGWPILDPYAQLMVMAWMIYDYWNVKPVPNFWHWPDAPDGTKGSTRIVMEELAPLYPELAG